VPAVSTLGELRAAVSGFAVSDVDIAFEPDALAAARRSLDGTGLLLLGEFHGVAENPLLARCLMGALGVDSLALEWPADLAPTVEAYLGGDELADHPHLWGGDGRVTAGHLRVLRDMRAEGTLTLTLFDAPFGVAGQSWSQRDEAMSDRLLGSDAARLPTLVVAGGLHTQTVPGPYGVPLGANLAAVRPGVRGVETRYRSGGFYNLEPRTFSPRPGGRDGLYTSGDRLVVELPEAHEAVVPHRSFS
jgi:hypothetical protein